MQERPPLNYFKAMVNFGRGMPNKAGVKWKTRSPPVYFENQFEGWLQSKLVVRQLFPFLAPIVRQDLYQHNLAVAEKHSSHLPMSKRNLIFGKQAVLFENDKESQRRCELFPRAGIDPFAFECQLYYAQ